MTTQAANSRFQQLNCYLIELRMRMGFDTFRANADVEGREDSLREDLVRLLGARAAHWQKRLPYGLHPDQRKEILREFVDNIEGNLMQRWRRGDLYAFRQAYLDDQLRGQLTTLRRESQKGPPAPEKAPPPGLEPDERECLQECYDRLRGRIADRPHAPLVSTLEEWIRSRGHRWLLRFVRDLATQHGEDFKRLYAKAYNQWLPYLRDLICQSFQDFVMLSMPKLASLPPNDRADGLIVLLHDEGIGPACAGNEADIPPPTQPSTPVAAPPQPPSLDEVRFRWLRDKQRERIWEQATSDSRLLLELYAGGSRLDVILHQVYGADPAPLERLNSDLDCLHGWYEEITQDALLTLDAWRFYDAIKRRHGVGRMAEVLHQEVDYPTALAPVIEAARKHIPFHDLPEALSIPRGPGEVRGDLLRMRELWNQARRQPHPSLPQGE